MRNSQNNFQDLEHIRLKSPPQTRLEVKQIRSITHLERHKNDSYLKSYSKRLVLVSTHKKSKSPHLQNHKACLFQTSKESFKNH